MTSVFVSYSRLDRPLAQSIVEELGAAGHDVWWDQRLTPQDGFDKIIEDALKDAEAVVVLWTKHSVSSEWVRNEASFAIDKLVPARFEAVDLPIAFHRFQTADLTDWTPGERSAEWTRLLGWIEDKSDSAALRPTASKPARKVTDESGTKPPVYALAVLLMSICAALVFAAFAVTSYYAQPDECAKDFPDARELASDQSANIPIGPDCIERDFSLFKDCDTCPQIVTLPPGEFEMGTSSFAGGQSDERPVRKVKINYRFGIGRFEVSWGEWNACVAAAACETPGHHRDDRTASLPVHALSWNQTHDYLEWISARTGETYRLPTEAEWEYAAKSGQPGQYMDANDVSGMCTYANVRDRSFRENVEGMDIIPCRDGIAYRAPVGTFSPNTFGLYDMLGNVAEPVQDCYINSYAKASDFGDAYEFEGCKGRVIRGGAYDTSDSRLRVGFRDATRPAAPEPRLGLRVVREIR